MNRRNFIAQAAIATAAAGLVRFTKVEGGEKLSGEVNADTVEIAPDEVGKMYINRKFPGRPDVPCPLPKSSSIKNIHYTYRNRSYRSRVTADTWLTSWASDGNLYSSYADGIVQGVGVICHLDGVDEWYCPASQIGYYPAVDRVLGWGDAKRPPKFLSIKKNPTNLTTTGNAIVLGDDPFNLNFQVLAPTELTLTWFASCYPSGCLVKDGNWFYACQYRNHFVDKNGNQQCFAQGPNRIRISRDFGKTWAWSPFDDHDPVIPEIGACAGNDPLKFGNAHFVDFGKNMEHSPDGFAYLIGHGTCEAEGMSNWSTGDAIFLGRVMPTPEAINRKSAYEYFAGRNPDGRPIWSHSFGEIKPIFEWASRCGMTYVTYFPAIRKYLAVVCAGWPNGGGSQRDAWIAEADQLWGPWSIVTYWDSFAESAYYGQIPSKFIKPDGTFAMFYSGDWGGPTPIPAELKKPASLVDYPKAEYGLCVAEFRLEM